jgi:hypothetical protein
MIIDLKDDLIVRDSVIADIEPIAENMRKSDRDEIMASHRRQPINALALGYAGSTLCFTVEYKGEPCAMFGTVPESLLSNKANVWLLASNKFCKCHKKLAKYSKTFINFLLSHYSELGNFVDMRNKASINWLKHYGAEIEEAKPFGEEKRPFHRFIFRRGKYALA